VLEEQQGSGVRGVQVVQDDQHRGRARRVGKHRGDVLEEFEPSAQVTRPRFGRVEQASDALMRHDDVGRKRTQDLQPRPEGRRPEPTSDRPGRCHAGRACGFIDLVRQPGLARSRRAGQQEDATAARTRGRDRMLRSVVHAELAGHRASVALPGPANQS
jgi:hypothetical protein